MLNIPADYSNSIPSVSRMPNMAFPKIAGSDRHSANIAGCRKPLLRSMWDRRARSRDRSMSTEMDRLVLLKGHFQRRVSHPAPSRVLRPFEICFEAPRGASKSSSSAQAGSVLFLKVFSSSRSVATTTCLVLPTCVGFTSRHHRHHCASSCHLVLSLRATSATAMPWAAPHYPNI